MKPYNYKPSTLFTKPYLSTDYLLYSFYVPNANSEDSQINKLRIFHRLLVKIDKLFDRHITGYFSFIYKGTLHYYFEGDVLNEVKGNFPQNALPANILVGLTDTFYYKYNWRFLSSLSFHYPADNNKDIIPYDEAMQYLMNCHVLNQAKSAISADHSTIELKIKPDPTNTDENATIKTTNPELKQTIVKLWRDSVNSKFSYSRNPAFFATSWVYQIMNRKEFNPNSNQEIEAMIDLLKQHHTNKSRAIIDKFNAEVVTDLFSLIKVSMDKMGISTNNKLQ